MKPSERAQPALSRWPHVILAGLAAAVALWSLAGWWFSNPTMIRLLPGRPALAPMTALGLLAGAAGAASLRIRPRLARALGIAEALLGLMVLVVRLGAVDAAGLLPLGWWSSPITGALFVLCGLAACLLTTRRVVAGQVASLTLILTALLLAIGHAFASLDVYRYLAGTGVSILTVAAFLALAASKLIAYRDRGIVAAFSARNFVSGTGLRLTFGGLGLIALLTLVLLVAHQVRLDAESSLLLLGWGAAIVLVGSVWRMAFAVDRAEAARAAAEEDRDRMRRMMVAAITHDLRNPLQTASLATTLLERTAAEAGRQRAIGQLQQSHRRLDRLLRSMLDSLAMEEHGRMSLQPTAFALEDAVRELLRDHPVDLGERVVLTGSAHGRWDRDAVSRVIENLLLNALKYGTPGAPIACRLAVEGTPANAVLAVTNRGVPIPAGEWESIFHAFRRGATADTAARPGWGVGLAFARLVAQAHGGSIRVAASSEAEGTTFELRLPLEPPS